MSLTPPPPPPHKPSSISSITGCESVSSSKPTKLKSRSFTSTPPLSSISTSSTNTSSTSTSTSTRSDEDPFPSDPPDAGRLREILVDITEETNNRSIGLRRNLTTPMSPTPSPHALPSTIPFRRPHTGPITRSRSMIILPPPASRSRAQTPSVTSSRRSSRLEGVDENDSSPATSRSVSSQLSLTPNHPSLHHSLYTPSPLGHRTFEHLHPTLPALRLRPSVAAEPVLTRRRRRRSEDESVQGVEENTREEAPVRSTRVLRRVREDHATRSGPESELRQLGSDDSMGNSMGGNHREEKRRKRNSTSLVGLGRL